MITLFALAAWRCDHKIRYGDEWFVSRNHYNKNSVVVSRVQSLADWKLTICFHDEAGKEKHCIFDPGDTTSYLVDVFWATEGDEAYLAACEGMDIYGYSFSRGHSVAPNAEVERGIIQQFSEGVEQDESVRYHRFEDFCRGMSRGLADALHKKYFMRLP
ncbi:MAG: hypothetical protein NW208_14190 [Bryobacter sp.]|nr:hypothetical protein [Bryobacter sp.]